jgi:two-component system, sensor histidine kinase LadS
MRLLFLYCLWVSHSLLAQSPPKLVYSDSSQYVETTPYAATLEDIHSEWSIEQVRAMPQQRFKATPQSRLNFGDSESRFWVRINLDNHTKQDLYLLNVVPIVQYLDLYVVYADGRLKAFPPSGLLRPIQNRAQPIHKINFHLGASAQTLYFSVKGNRTLYFSNYVGTRDALDAYVRLDERIYLFCFGIYFILIIYNLVIYLYGRDKPFLWYAIFQAGVLTYFLYYSGLGWAYLWQDIALFNYDSNIHAAASVIPACIFTMYFLDTRHILPTFHVYLRLLVVGYLAVLLVQLVGYVVLSNHLAQFFNFTTYLSLWVAALLAYLRGHKTIRFYLMGWTLYLFSVLITVLFATNTFPTFASFSIDNYAISIGSIAEATFLAFALADRVYDIRQQARHAQDLLIQQKKDYETLVERHNQLLNPFPVYHETPPEVAQRIEQLIESIQSERELIRKISIPTIEGVILLPMTDIMFVEAMRSYAMFHLSNNKKLLASRPIIDFEDVLPEQTFFRVHKSHLVNLNYMERYIRGEGGSVVLQDGSEISVSRTAKVELLRRLRIS